MEDKITEQFRTLYVDEKKSMYEIIDILGITKRKAELTLKAHPEWPRFKSGKTGRKPEKELDISDEELVKEYNTDKTATRRSLAAKYNVSEQQIRKVLARNNTKMKDSSFRTSQETKDKISNREWLYQEYMIKGKSIETIAQELGDISTFPLYKLVKKFNFRV